MSVIVVVCAVFGLTIPESTAIFGVEAADQVYVCMYVLSSHIAEYGSNG